MEIVGCRAEENTCPFRPPAMLFHGISGGHIQGIMEEMERRSKTESRLAKGGQMNGRETVRRELAPLERGPASLGPHGTAPTWGQLKALPPLPLPRNPELVETVPGQPPVRPGAVPGRAGLTCICPPHAAGCALRSTGGVFGVAVRGAASSPAVAVPRPSGAAMCAPLSALLAPPKRNPAPPGCSLFLAVSGPERGAGREGALPERQARFGAAAGGSRSALCPPSPTCRASAAPQGPGTK